jgi:hypothetical protein
MSSIAPGQGSRNALAYVYDGRECLGHVLSRGKLGFEAFGPDDKSIGLIPNRTFPNTYGRGPALRQVSSEPRRPRPFKWLNLVTETRAMQAGSESVQFPSQPAICLEAICWPTPNYF